MAAAATGLVFFAILWPVHFLARRDETPFDESKPNLQAQGEILQGSSDSTEADTFEDVEDDDPQTDGASEAGKPGVGMPCTGSMWHSRGNCGTLSIKGVDDVVRKIQLYCYSVALKGRPGAKASNGIEGECKVPRRKFCLEDEQCRRGTYCQPCESNNGYTCQEVTQAYMHGRLDTTLVADTVSAMLLFITDNYLTSLKTAASSQEGLIRDPRTGAVSPYGVNPQLAISAIRDLRRSFATGNSTVAGENSASKSGAAFIHSGDGRFIIKSIRSSEFTAFNGELVDKIAARAKFELADCRSDNTTLHGTVARSSMVLDPPWCWMTHALAHTTLMVPLLAFSNPKRNEYWIAMPAAAQMRGLVSSHNLIDMLPWGPVSYFDTKPLPAKSNARPQFLRKLPQLGFLPRAYRSHPSHTAQWNDLEEALLKDVGLLSAKTEESAASANLVDYSLLFELYQPSRKVREPGPGCISSAECFYKEGTGGCWVLCVSIIDYLVTFGPMRKLESMFKGGKFSGYGTKVIEMLQCMFEQAMPEDAHEELVQADLHNDWYLYQFRRGPQVVAQDRCAEYTEIGCGDLNISRCDFDQKSIEYVGQNFGRRTDFCGLYWAWKAFDLANSQHLQDTFKAELSFLTAFPLSKQRFC